MTVISLTRDFLMNINRYVRGAWPEGCIMGSCREPNLKAFLLKEFASRKKCFGQNIYCPVRFGIPLFENVLHTYTYLKCLKINKADQRMKPRKIHSERKEGDVTLSKSF